MICDNCGLPDCACPSTLTRLRETPRTVAPEIMERSVREIPAGQTFSQGEHPFRLVRGQTEKRGLVSDGYPAHEIWTAAEILDLPWEENPTVAHVFETFVRGDGP